MKFSSLFKGGIHVPDSKDLSMDKPIRAALAPKVVVVPLCQHLGSPSTLGVGAGDKVAKGQMIGDAFGAFSSTVHSPVSGIVTMVRDTVLHNGKTSAAVTIENDGQETWATPPVKNDVTNLSAAAIIQKVKQAGIVGMGGAGFPSPVKLSIPEGKAIDTVIINGVECEPYLTADYRLMVEKPQEIIAGVQIIMKTVGATAGIIAVEKNKPEAIAIFKKLLAKNPAIKVCGLPVKYPQGNEKLLIKAVVNREIPSGKLPSDVGAVVHNVGTVFAIYETIHFGKPLIERIVTISGDAIPKPANLLVKIGTPIHDLIRECGSDEAEYGKVIIGGPMMGFAISDLEVPVVKSTTGVLVFSKAMAAHADRPSSCFRCGRCLEACPMGLSPGTIGRYIEMGDYEKAKAAGLATCMECGSCSYVCPANRQIVQQLQLGKARIKK